MATGLGESQETREEVKLSPKKERKQIATSFAWYNLGVFFFWSAYFALGNLQSSVNIKGGLGTFTLGASFFTSVLCGICFAPVIIRRFGAKRCLVIADLSVSPFILANLYPTFYTLLPAGVVMAILLSPMWPTMSMINVFFASQFDGVSKRPKDLHIITFSGYFFTSFQASQVFGSLVSYVILYGIDSTSIPSMEMAVNCTETGNKTCNVTIQDYSHCGVHDCQNATIIEEAISQYEPVNRVSLYVLIGVALLFEVTALLLHTILLPPDRKFEEKRQQYEAAALVQKEGRPSPSGNDESTLIEGNDSQHDDTDKSDVKETGSDWLAIDTMKSLFRHAISLKLILIVPITLYNGLVTSFISSELTRSMASCTLGVQWVGICVAVYALSDSILSWVVGKFGRRVGRIPMFLIALVLESGNYLYCFMWSAGPHLLLSVFAIFFSFGVTDGILQTIINVTHIDFFTENQDVAIAVWNVLFESGLGLGFVLSTTFCVGARIYFNMAFLCLGIVGLVVAELYHRRTLLRGPKQIHNQKPSSHSE